MKVLILGGTGVISREIVKQCLECGFDVTMFNRGNKQVKGCAGAKVILGDRNDKLDFIEKMKSVNVDVLIDMIAFNKIDAEQTIDVFKNKTKQIIFTSSVAAYKRPYNSFPIAEDKEELCTDPVFQYSFQKAEMERYLQHVMKEKIVPITIIRPSLTFGIGASNIGVLRQNYNIIKRMQDKKPLVLFGEGTIPWSFTFVEDLARGYILSCNNEKTYNECFHITNDEIVLWEDLYNTIGEIIGETPSYVYVPSQVLKNARPDLFAHFYYEKKFPSLFDNSKFKSAAPKYKANVSLKEGMEKIVKWWIEEANIIDEEKDRMEDDICTCYNNFEREITKSLNNA